MAGAVDVLIQHQVLSIHICGESGLAFSLRLLGHLGALAVVSMQRKMRVSSSSASEKWGARSTTQILTVSR